MAGHQLITSSDVQLLSFLIRLRGHHFTYDFFYVAMPLIVPKCHMLILVFPDRLIQTTMTFHPLSLFIRIQLSDT